MSVVPPVPNRPPPLPAARDDLSRLKEKAVELEAAFLSEMLAHAGLDESLSRGTGGDGADPFASFLREQEAMQIARKGGIGLSESIFRALVREAGHDIGS